MTVTERERRRMELVDGSAHRTELCEQLAMREYELDNLRALTARLIRQLDLSVKYDVCPSDARRLRDKELARELGVEVSA